MKSLIIVDVQNDFCPGGSLAVADGNKIIPVINKLTCLNKFDRVIATQDWHPDDHCSFKEYDGLWPRHCVKGTRGAELNSNLDQTYIDIVLRKGGKKQIESYSAFGSAEGEEDTGLKYFFTGWHDIYICGIATDVCVLNTAFDAIEYANVFVVADACAGVTIEGSEKAILEMKRFGIKIINSSEIGKNNFKN